MASRPELMNPELDPDDLRQHLQDWISSYRSAATRLAFRKALEVFDGWMTREGLKLHEIRRRDGDRYREWLEKEAVNAVNGRPLGPATITQRVLAMSAMFKYLIDEEIYIRNPFFSVRRPPRELESKTVGLTRAEAAALIKTAMADEKPMIGALIWLLISTGLRIAEVEKADIGDLLDNSHGMSITVRRKGDRGSRVGIPGPAADAMRRYLDVREDAPSGALFVHNGQRIRPRWANTILPPLCEKAGVPRVSPHGLRHTCATLMLDTGASIGDVQLQLGHTSLSTTLRYDRARRARADAAGNALTDALLM